MGMAPLNHREGSCITAQKSTLIRKKLKSVPENAEKKKKFPVFNEIKKGDPLQFQK